MDPRNSTPGVVLAVDDTPANLRVLVETLSSSGYEVLVATDGHSAIETARYARPDLILLDVLMPGIDGYQTCEELKKVDETAAIPIIFMTALSETEDKVKAFELGAVDYITKPFEQAELLARVSTHITLARLRKALEARNQQLEELNKLKNEFMGMAAHDVRNPLSSVLACAELVDAIADSVPPEKVRLLVGQIATAARRISDIVTNLLDVNAIDSGQRRLQIEAHDLAGVVARVVLQNGHKAAAKGITVQYVPPAEPVAALVDVGAAEQVIDNIVSNAVKYSPADRQVFVRLGAGDGVVRIEVQDQGPGISKEDQAKMYGKFCRLSAKPTAGEPSTGLGLWIVKELTETMKGTIRCESEMGQGTMFVVEWPCAPAHA
jgi:two-component system, sensor histidine kinase and response regulator